MTTLPHSEFHNPNSRFQVRPVPTLSPAKCLSCGSPHRAVIDTLVDLDVNGYNYRVYLCILCVKDMASQVEGYLESRGEIQSGATTVADILAKNNLKVVTNEQYESISRWYADGASLFDLPSLDSNVATEEVFEGLSGYTPEADDNVQSEPLDLDFGDSILNFRKSKASGK